MLCKKISCPHFPEKHLWKIIKIVIPKKLVHQTQRNALSKMYVYINVSYRSHVELILWFQLIGSKHHFFFLHGSCMWCFSGEVYTWGRDEGDGRLGLGSGGGPGEAGSMSVPSKVKALPVPVSAVACGGFFTLALTPCGELWSWGGNKRNSNSFCL